MELTDIIIEKISTNGPISFRDFMDMCLYYPELGYYTSERQKIGQNGDFYTSSSITSAYGTTIAQQMEEMWHTLGRKEFTIVEYGAGLGYLCYDILNELRKNEALYKNLRYCIIEKSPFMQKKEKELLMDKVSWYNDINEISNEIDCVFSNELFDNFPVHQVIMKDQLMEVLVDYRNGFHEILQPAGQPLISYFKELSVNLPINYRTEVNLEATKWLQDIAGRLKKGFVITVDYGATSESLYKERRKCGTIVCYNKHQISENPFSNIGEQDITSHVNFSALDHWGEIVGLSTCGITSQAFFLMSLGFQEHLRKTTLERGKNIEQNAREEALITYTLLFDMGSKYKVLIQSKGIVDAKFTGLQSSVL